MEEVVYVVRIPKEGPLFELWQRETKEWPYWAARMKAAERENTMLVQNNDVPHAINIDAFGEWLDLIDIKNPDMYGYFVPRSMLVPISSLCPNCNGVMRSVGQSS